MKRHSRMTIAAACVLVASLVSLTGCPFFNAFSPVNNPGFRPIITQCIPTQTVVADNSGRAELPDFASIAPLLGLSVLDTDTQLSDLEFVQDPPPGTAISEPGVNVTVTAVDREGHDGSCEFFCKVVPICDPQNQSDLNVASTRLSLTGTIDDVTETDEIFDSPGYLTIRVHRDIRYHIELDLTTDETGSMKGTASVTWSNRSFDVRRATCEDGTNVLQHFDYPDRSWTVNMVARLICVTEDGNPVLGVSGGGTPDGSEVPQPFVIRDSCTPYREERPDPEPGNPPRPRARATWASFYETGIVLDRSLENLNGEHPVYGELNKRVSFPLLPNTIGERYRDVKIKIVFK